ncbi:hypothetical protein CBR_g54243 [Chara braunii]|uniref:Uncharacterized protein n=1 Tax=Chara braunii TaxID=69332 RepID=A0A388K7E4_CHABU|nr:hypothetical protein CBR_g54243 [Chara braunii]|eukprot:GBG65951.1 hypothetical protein CBR_g54243 [Chara braunii]
MKELFRRIVRREQEEEEKKRHEVELARRKEEEDRREGEKIREEESRETKIESTTLRILAQRKESAMVIATPQPTSELKKRSPRSKARMLRDIRSYIVESEDDSEEMKIEADKLIEALENRKKGRTGAARSRAATSRVTRKSLITRKGKAKVAEVGVADDGFETPKKVCPAEASSEGLVEYALTQSKQLSGLKAAEIRKLCDREGVEYVVKGQAVQELVRLRRIITTWAQHIKCAMSGKVGNAPKLHRWLMSFGWHDYVIIPLITEIRDGFEVEQALIRRLSPSLNTIGRIKSGKKQRGRKRTAVDGPHYSGGAIIFECDEGRYSSLISLMDAIADRKDDVAIRSVAGAVWIGSWKKIRERFGESIIVVNLTRKKLRDARREVESGCDFRIVQLVATPAGTQRNKRFLKDLLAHPWRMRHVYKLASQKLAALYKTAGLFSRKATRCRSVKN